jgi:CBS domain-containing protein
MERFLEYVAGDVMTHRPIAIGSHATLAEAERIFERFGFNSLPVHDGEALLGVLTKLDLLRALDLAAGGRPVSHESIMAQEVQCVMTRDPVAVEPRTPLTRVLQIMVESRYKSLPVVIGALLLGVISREDVIRAVRRAAADQGPEPVHYWRAMPAGTGDPWRDALTTHRDAPLHSVI